MTRICVLGMGYIGLPTAAMFATHGFDVLGVDVNSEVVRILNNGDIHIEEPGLKVLVQAAILSGRLHIAQKPEPADAFIIAVPTPFLHNHVPHGPGLDERPIADLRFVVAATESIVPLLQPGNLVVLESTVPPRTVTEVLCPILRGASTGSATISNRSVEQMNLLVAHCPERVLPGRILEELVQNDRIVGGIDPPSAEAARNLYVSFVKGRIFLTDSTTAEMVKLMENTYRDVNIALANEFSLVAETIGVDIWGAIALANRHPRVNILRPGPGVGGHCIAVDPWFIAEAAPDITPLIQAARKINDSMPSHVVRKVREASLGCSAPVIACLGLTYKADVDDVRESPAVKVVDLLRHEGFVVHSYDPHAWLGESVGQVRSLVDAIKYADVVVILTDHAEFRTLNCDELCHKSHVVIDTRHCVSDGISNQPAAIPKTESISMQDV